MPWEIFWTLLLQLVIASIVLYWPVRILATGTTASIANTLVRVSAKTIMRSLSALAHEKKKDV